jgi:hypothetical protein
MEFSHVQKNEPVEWAFFQVSSMTVCSDLRGRQISPQSPVLTEEARRHKPQRFKIFNY